LDRCEGGPDHHTRSRGAGHPLRQSSTTWETRFSSAPSLTPLGALFLAWRNGETHMALILSKQDPLVTSERWEEFDSSTRIKLRGIDNPQYQVAVGRMRRTIDGFDAKAAGEPIAMDGERSFYQLQAAALARYVVLDWDGVLDDEGAKVPY